jgi:hypothetical protein
MLRLHNRELRGRVLRGCLKICDKSNNPLTLIPSWFLFLSEGKQMKFVVHAVLALALALMTSAGQAAAPSAAHLKAVQDLLGVMQVDKVLLGVASRSHYQSQAQKQAVFDKLGKTPPDEVVRRLAPSLTQVISFDTALEMTRFYNSPYGKQVIYRKYNKRGGIIMPGMRELISPEEKKERKRSAYVQASKELADAEPVIEHEAFKLLQQINKEKR